MSPVRRLRRVLVAFPSAGLGGAEGHTLVLARALAARGVQVVLAADPAVLPGLRSMAGTLPGATWHAAPLTFQEKAYPAGVIRQCAATDALLAELHPDAALVPLPWPPAALGIQQSLGFARIPTLVVGHLAPGRGVAGLIERNGGPPGGPLTYVAVAAPTARRLEAAFGLRPGDVQVVENGVPVPAEAPGVRDAARLRIRRQLGLSPGHPLILFAGYLGERKGAHLLPGLAAAIPDAAIAVLGDGPLRPLLQGAAEGRLFLPGHVREVSEWMLAADCLLLPSVLEGCPLVVLEAFARRLPVATSAAAAEWLGPAADNMLAGFNELTLPAILPLVEESLAPSQLRERRVHAAFQRVAAHDEAAMLDAYLGLLRGLLA